MLISLIPGRRGRPALSAFLAVLLLATVGSAPPLASSSASAAAGADDRSQAQTDDILPIRYDESTGKVHLTIPRLGEDLLYLNTLAAGLGLPGVGLDRGEVGVNALVRFERHGSRVLLVRQNVAFRATSADGALERSVAESFPRSVLASFAIQNEDGGRIVVDATDFLLSDVFDVIGRLRSARLGTVRLDRDRSVIDGRSTRSFPSNTEIRAILSFVTDDPGPELRRLAPDGRFITLDQHHSFVRLPDPPMAIRRFDPRAGIFPFVFFDFAQPFDGEYRQRGLSRWRLEPKDPAAYLRGELTEPVKPIVYYMDPAIPEPYRSAFVEGGEWWNRVFEAAGWRNGFRIEPLPEGVDPLDSRYPMMYWVHRAERGPSVGPSFRDPRSGEILTTIVRMDSYRSLVNHDIYMGLLPAASAAGLQLDAREFAMARRRQHAAHEIGHTLGLAHNFIAATQDRASVMDYPSSLVRLDAEGRLDISDAYSPSPGPHDTLAIRYAYTWYPTPEAEAAGLAGILRDAEQQGLRFVADAHVAAAGSIPGASQWVEGADMIAALRRTMDVRRVLLQHFDERAAQPGEPLAVLNRRFAHVYLHHRYALAGATKYIGGMDFTYAMAESGTPSPTRVLSPAEQREALALVLEALKPGELHVREAIVALIPPVPFGFDDDLTLVRSPAGTAFDAIALAHSLAQEVVDGLLHVQRAARVALFHARDPSNLPLDELMTALVEATWGAVARSSGGSDAMTAALRRVTERAVVDGLLDLAGSPEATPAVRATAESHLERLLARAGSEAGSDQDHAHRGTVRRDIERYLAGNDQRDARPRPEAVRLPWP